MADQWAFLASVRKIGRPQVEQIVEDAERRGRILGVRLPPQDDGETEPWTAPPSRRREAPIVGDLPATLELVLGNQIYIPSKACILDFETDCFGSLRFRTRVLQSAGDAAFDITSHASSRAPRISRITSAARGCLDDVRKTLTELGVAWPFATNATTAVLG